MAIDVSQPRFAPWALGEALKAFLYLPLPLVVGLERPASLYVDLEKVSRGLKLSQQAILVERWWE